MRTDRTFEMILQYVNKLKDVSKVIILAYIQIGNPSFLTIILYLTTKKVLRGNMTELVIVSTSG